MACHAVMTPKVETVSPEQSVEDVLALMEKKGVTFVPVVDKKKKLVGLFSYTILLKNLLPVSLSLSDDLQFDMKISAAPGIAKRLKKLLPLKVDEIMDRKANVIHPQTPTWEGIRFLVQHGEPLLVIEPETGQLAGVITGQSAFKEIQRLKNSET